jgi:hypothetical protein
MFRNTSLRVDVSVAWVRANDAGGTWSGATLLPEMSLGNPAEVWRLKKPKW